VRALLQQSYQPGPSQHGTLRKHEHCNYTQPQCPKFLCTHNLHAMQARNLTSIEALKERVLQRVGTGEVAKMFHAMRGVHQMKREGKIKNKDSGVGRMVESLHATKVCVFTPGRHFVTMSLDFYSVLGSVNFEDRHDKLVNKLTKTRRDERHLQKLREFDECKLRTHINQAAGGCALEHHGPEAVARR
jgi:hypothetical protein